MTTCASTLHLPTWRRRHLVGGLLVGAMLLVYCLVLAASMRQVERDRSVQASVLRARMICERLPQARDRGACVEVALRGDSGLPSVRP